MKKIFQLIYSSKTTVVLLIILMIAMGTGTFIEDKYDTLTARNIIYNSKWFEFLFLLLALNFIGHIKTFNMLRKEKLSGLIFHLAFVVMIFGAGITRYFGYEGTMHIREGEASNILYSSDPYLRISLGEKNGDYNKDFSVNFGPYSGHTFYVELPTPEKEKIEINCKEYISNAVEKIEDNAPGGVDLLELVVATENGRKKMFIEKGQAVNIGKATIAFNNEKVNDAVKVYEKDGMLQVIAPFEMTQANMVEKTSVTFQKDTLVEFKNKHLYTVNEAAFFFTGFHKSAVQKLVSSPGEETGFDALLFDITINNKKHEAPLLFAPGQVAEYSDFTFEKVPLKIAFGKKPIELPFSIYLKDFILERYAGSESPSSYASEVTVMDNRNSLKLDHRIFMNNVLDYDNYRFFQSSYDQDEKGTILSVNHDFWGTWISYVGYILLALGFITTLFNSRSRFHLLRHNIGAIRKNRKSIATTILLITGLSTAAFSQNTINPAVDANHADKFGHLITQSIDGRFEPVHSLAYDVMHKISRKDKFNIDGKGEMDAIQVFMDIIINPAFWKQQQLVYIKEKSVRDIIGITTKAASFADFFDKESRYKLQSYSESAFRKKPVERNNFDKEIIKVDERVNVFMMAFQASILKIFPEQDSPNNKWIGWEDKTSTIPLKGVINIINQDLQLPVLNYRNLMQVYFAEVARSVKSGDYTRADKILGYIANIQRQGEGAKLLPSEKKINAEIFYNKAQIFIVLRNCYSILSLVLLLLAFIDNVKSKKSKIITWLLNISIAFLGVAFLYQTFGMALRSYLLGYAPWSNGYEALLLVAWGTLLAGFSFVRYSKITLAATTLLAFFILMTASHSSYDPQLTNLTPVLKSYWLIIHVAVLTISYGFLGLGFVLGIMNLFIYVFKTKENHKRLDLLILELTFINEMNLTIGIVLATVGTFLGGVWANESWGRYWGWDAKETWALVIVITYTLLLHLRLIPKLNGKYLFNVASVISFGSVLMTFFGVNYFLSKGMHSYGAGDHAIFPLWAWIAIFSLILLMIAAKIKENIIRKHLDSETE
ncbi:MAG: cytochrome c biogenesis protein CcsA [Bacteroidetes bacterium]|nr:cytochrome c biogenesis protein CcsA [Bacteroidota bacterium]